MAKKGRKSSKPRKPKAEPREVFPREDVLEAAEDLLVSTSTRRKAERELARMKKLSTRHASRYVEFALERWKHDSDSDPAKRRERRAELDAKVDHVYELCVNKGFAITKKNGTVVRKIDVDSKGAIAALQMKALLHNLLAPDTTVGNAEDEDALLKLANKHFGGVVLDVEGEEVPAVPALPPPTEAP